MNRTEWPLLNRARVHGIKLNKAGVFRVDPRNIIPFNINYAINTCPFSHKTPAGDYLLGTDIAPPFDNVWHEWQEDLPAEDGHVKVDMFALTIAFGHEIEVFIGMSERNHRFDLREQPIQPQFNVSIDLKSVRESKEENITVNDPPNGLLEKVNATIEHYERDAVCFSAEVLWAWLLLSCKNVETTETQPNRRSRKAQKDPTRIIHRELLVKAPPGGRKGASNNNEDEHGVAFHVRRGHFADYTKGKGLFGKYKGRFWIPPTTVGDRDYGTVIKSYRIIGGQK